MDPLKMYFLFNMGIFHCCVSLPEGTYPYTYIVFIYSVTVYIYSFIYIIQLISVTSDLSLQTKLDFFPGAVEKPA